MQLELQENTSRIGDLTNRNQDAPFTPAIQLTSFPTLNSMYQFVLCVINDVYEQVQDSN